MEYTENIRNKYSLESLEYHVRIGSSQGYLEDILNNLEEEDLLEACIICQEAAEDVKKYSLLLLQRVNANTVAENLCGFLEVLASNKENLRAVCLDCLKKLNSEQLADNLCYLLTAMRSDFFFTRFYAEELISLLKPKDLKWQKRLIISEYKSSQEGCQPDCRRVMEYLMKNILEGFDLLDVYQNKELLYKITQSKNQKLKEEARFNLLKMIKEECHNNEPFRELLSYWDFLSDCELSPVDKVAENATLIKLSLIERFSVRRKEDNVDYLVDLQKSNHREIKRQSRQLALSVFESWPKEMLFKYRNFLIRCQESKYFLIRWRSAQLIQKITSYQWSQDIEGLLTWHLSGYNHVRRAVRKILVNLSSTYLLANSVPAILQAQRSIDSVHRKLALTLANKISQAELKKAKKFLEEAVTARQKNLSSLATSLLEKVS